ncbi:MAG TPA: hypothetical protein VGR56_07175 [Nitrososphaerales archaeon]|nr:hypothetical protein [Nitrososphaerales archaeon]
MKELDDDVINQEERRILLDLAKGLVDICQTNMEKALSTLSLETFSESDVQTNLLQVEDFCRVTERIARNYKNPSWVEETAKRSFPIPFSRRWSFSLRSLVSRVYKEQVLREGIQYDRFLGHGPGYADKRILAEAITLFDKYKLEDASTEMFIASCDTGFFSPVRIKRDGMSSPITDEIHRRYGITCDWPYAISPLLK